MTDLHISFSAAAIVGSQNADLIGHHHHFLNGVDQGDHTPGSMTHGHTGLDSRKTFKIKFTSHITSIPADGWRHHIRCIVHGVNVLQIENNLRFSTGEFTLELTYLGRGLTGPPTYLETLDKLDQYSKAQYIPSDRR